MCFNLVYEAVLAAMVLALVFQGEQPSEVQGYLIGITAANGVFFFIKAFFFYCTPNRRRSYLNEMYKLIVQLLQGVTNVVFFILSYTTWGNIQWWFWDDPQGTKGFLGEIVGIILGCIEYYWLFLIGCVILLGLIFIGIALCNGVRSR